MKRENIAKLKREQLKLKRVPQRGKAFIAYKKVRERLDGVNDRAVILTLLVPAGARRTGGNLRTEKSRFSSAKVISAEYRDGKKTKISTFLSFYTAGYRWRVGRWHRPTNGYSSNPYDTCAPGLHGFLSKKSAQQYRY